MLGRRLDNIHPYGIRVAPGGPQTPAVTRAIDEASKEVDKALADLNAPAKRKNGKSGRSPASRSRRSPAR